jgi:hypothetical protein
MVGDSPERSVSDRDEDADKERRRGQYEHG